jgi:hypothetical protein
MTGDCALWARLTGPQFAAQVAAVVCLVETPANHSKASTVAKEVMAIKYINKTSRSITKFLESTFAGKHPKLIKKGTKAAAAEAAVTAAEAIAAVDLRRPTAWLLSLRPLSAVPSTWRSLRRPNPGKPLARVLARTRAAPRVGGPLDQSRGNLDGPHGRFRRGG